MYQDSPDISKAGRLGLNHSHASTYVTERTFRYNDLTILGTQYSLNRRSVTVNRIHMTLLSIAPALDFNGSNHTIGLERAARKGGNNRLLIQHIIT